MFETARKNLKLGSVVCVFLMLLAHSSVLVLWESDLHSKGEGEELTETWGRKHYLFCSQLKRSFKDL